jgi:hypothetical protein
MQGSATNVHAHSPAGEKIALFRSLFRGREDVYPRRFENQRTGRAGYAPACGNEWVRGICEKPRVKCSDCPHRAFLPVTDEVIRWHLSGKDSHGKDFVAGRGFIQTPRRHPRCHSPCNRSPSEKEIKSSTDAIHRSTICRSYRRTAQASHSHRLLPPRPARLGRCAAIGRRPHRHITPSRGRTAPCAPHRNNSAAPAVKHRKAPHRKHPRRHQRTKMTATPSASNGSASH